ncbi:Uncharacterised protein [Actinobacillus porcinus]|uniref:Uncharacterized protein n=1 Tax=Actinobacillus porcinus TaxID=51048 RepID=A0ABY6TN12_9PAST|nr:hypothetical protein [Actinobacillus porcinus]VFY93485.1 Uncharacterised protein [Actinobacillus porcinus]VTU08621.1 Uncharacterised protein [Actinobacillus porcinus]
MISEEDKKEILNGAYGISRDGVKCKYVGLSDYENYPYVFIYFNDADEIARIHQLSEDFRNIKDTEHEIDVVGLWENQPKPFNLEKALAGEPVMLRNGSKACVLSKLPKNLDFNYIPDLPLIGLEKGSLKFIYWTEDGRTSTINDETPIDIIGMWKKPEPVSNMITVTLPCPIKEPTGQKWSIDSQLDTPQSTLTDIYDETFISKGCYFNTKEDAQAWLDAMRNNRR